MNAPSQPHYEQTIREQALKLGFSFCGIAANESLDFRLPFYTEFLKRDGQADLTYLKTQFENRFHPDRVMEGTQSVVAVLMNYFPEKTLVRENNFIISKHTYGRDYHVVMRERITRLTGFMKELFGEIRLKSFIDSGPVLEKLWAQRCGLGWQGKNTILINPTAGSFFFIGIIFTDRKLQPDTPETDHCGNCMKCVRACPNGALNTPYQLDIARCISYLNIETNGASIPAQLKNGLNNRIYGCDICQDVCPYNKSAAPTRIEDFHLSEELQQMRKKDWISLTENQFKRLFTGSSIERIGYQRFMINIRRLETI
ncbi:MAG: tRNA epoxyqueuosine(34) reductase QueG [Bacteroidales bacterium]|nr:tRNA epoxyqueuosine(34) reductase QueG [Bacteroidales bacterium]